MRAEYAIVLGLVLLFPLLLSADRKLGMYRNVRALAATILIVSVPYWIWDIIAIARGHWSFHPERTLGPELFNMPVEEWMFFPVLAFVAIFTWESTKYFLGRRR